MLRHLTILATFLMSTTTGNTGKALLSLGWKRVLVVAQQHGTLLQQARGLAKYGTHVAVGECFNGDVLDVDGIGGLPYQARWGSHLFRRFRNMFSESSPCLLGKYGTEDIGYYDYLRTIHKV